MKVAIYQTSPILLDLRANIEEVVGKIHQGREKGAQLIVFPELALTGYFVGQRYLFWLGFRLYLRNDFSFGIGRLLFFEEV